MRFEILGDVRVFRNGEPVDLGPAKQRAVLAVLLLQPGRPVPTHQIVDAVWGDDPPENGVNVVQKYVAGLRRVLDPDRAPRTPGELLALTGSGYVLRVATSTLDADLFQTGVAAADIHRRGGRITEAAEELHRALALWRGDALAGLAGPAFEAARARLAEARATAYEKWADAELALGHGAALVPELSRLIDQFPLREGLRALLMTALHQAGRQAEALAVFRDAREYYLDEFGAEPGERMQEAHRKILRGEAVYPAAVAAPTSVPAPSVPPPPVPAPYVPAPYVPAPSVPAPYVPEPPPQGTYVPYRPTPPASVPVITQKPRLPYGEIVFAVLTPILLCGFSGWVYFTYAAIRRHQKRQFLVAAIYMVVWVGLVLLAFVVDPSPYDSDDATVPEVVGVLLLCVFPLVAAAHGAFLAVRDSESTRDWTVRESARQFAAFEPARALELGIGRPDLPRLFSDGGLVDINHASGSELATLPGVPPHVAQRILANREAQGAFRTPEELVTRGLIAPHTLRRVVRRLICIPDPLPGFSAAYRDPAYRDPAYRDPADAS